MDWIKRLTAFLPFVGVAIAGYLSVAKMMGLDVACLESGGCSEVALWVDKNLGGFPIAYVGVAGYLILAIIALVGMVTKKDQTKTGLMISGAGTLASLVLMVISFGVIKATCWWCVGSAITMTAIFGCYFALSKSNAEPKTSFGDYGVFGIGLILSIVGIMSSITYFTKKLPQVAPGTIENYIPANAKMYGKPDAPITIVEFFDFTCPYCKQSFPHFKDMIDRSNGQAKIVFHQFPFVGKEGHEMAAPAAVIGEMAHEKGKFVEYAEIVFDMDKSIMTFDRLVEAAAKVGLDAKEVRKRAANDKDSAYVALDKDLKQAHELGIQITPTYFVGRKGTRVDLLLFNNVIDVLTGVRYGLPKPTGL